MLTLHLKSRRRKIAIAFIAGFVLFAAWIRLGPIPDDLLQPASENSVIVTDRNGVVLYESLASDGAKRMVIDAKALPERLVQATLAAEDKRFFYHPGVDPIAIARAAVHNVVSRRVVEGGSTLTQQVAKMLLKRRGRNVGSKLREARLAMRLEHRFSKREILALYLNLAPYGNQFIGAERASRGYFGRPAGDLTVAQAAFLASLPQRPTTFNPYRNIDAASRRQQRILAAMKDDGVLSMADYDVASKERLQLVRPNTSVLAPHFVEMVLAQPAAAAAKRIVTTLDSGLQREVQGIVNSHRAMLEKHGAANVAVVVLDNKSGEWLAWEGSGNYFDSSRGGMINGPLTPRQPGSALKPFTYAAAFENGETPASVLADIPSHFPTAEEGVLYSPRNYDNRFRGPLTARNALAGSVNVPAVALASRLGVPSLLRLLRESGFTTFDKNAAYYGLGATLGNAEVPLAELTRAYAMFARGGIDVDPRTIHMAAAPKQRRIVSDRAAFWITDILSDSSAREFIFGRGGSLDFPFPVAVKTGTSQAYHDNWTVGYTREVTVGVWVGNFSREVLQNSSGVTGAAPIFHAAMLAAQKRVMGRFPGAGDPPIVATPPDLISKQVCRMSGALATTACPTTARELVPRGAITRHCAWHLRTPDGVMTMWPAEYRTWAQAAGHQLASLPRGRDEARLKIVSPPAGAVYLIDPTLRRQFQMLSLRAATLSSKPLTWTVNGRQLGSTPADTPLKWALARGKHVITVTDGTRRDEAEIVVK